MFKILTVVLLTAVSVFAQTVVNINVINGSINGISDNGKVFCGYDQTLGQGFYWTEGTGKVLLGQSEAFGVSNDTIIAGRFKDPNTLTNGNPTWVAAYYKNDQWHKVSGITGVPPLDEQSYTHAYSINAEGTRMTGMVWHPNYKVEACYWMIPDTGIGLLGMVNKQNSRADDQSNDGSIIVGWNAGIGGTPDREPYYWDPAPHFMGSVDTTWSGGECNGISPDGNILVGTSSSSAFVYTQANGMKAINNPVLGYWGGWANDVSNNGVVVGHIDEGVFTYKAFIKLPEWEYSILLSTYLIDSLQVTGIADYYFIYARCISADGKTFAGELANNTYPFGGAGFIITIENNVPVELTSFTADVNGSSVSLNWSTASENNNSGFEIERKTDKTEWQKIGFAAGKGTTSEISSYNFIDNTPAPSKYYYRLRQIDLDGTSEYSDVISIQVNTPFQYSLDQNYPNPFNPSTKIRFTIPEASVVKIKVYNSIGETAADLVNELYEAGQHEIIFNAAEGLASGMYFVRMEAGSFTSVRKISLIK